jgi:hypothetical protein
MSTKSLSFDNDLIIGEVSKLLFTLSFAWIDKLIPTLPTNTEYKLSFTEAGGEDDKNGVDAHINSSLGTITPIQFKMDMRAFDTGNFFLEQEMVYKTGVQAGCMSKEKIEQSLAEYYVFILPAVGIYTFSKQDLIKWLDKYGKSRKLLNTGTTVRNGESFNARGIATPRYQFEQEMVAITGQQSSFIPFSWITTALWLEDKEMRQSNADSEIGYGYILSRYIIVALMEWANNYKETKHWTQQRPFAYVEMLKRSFPTDTWSVQKFGYVPSNKEFASKFDETNWRGVFKTIIENSLTFKS